MRVYTDLGALPETARSVAIGTFDGVHAGHQKVITTAVEEARNRGLHSTVLTFAGHPLSLLEPGRKPRSAVKKDEIVRDEALDRAVALIKARDVLGRLKGKEN